MSRHSEFLASFDLFSVIIFSIEYLLRLWTADEAYPGHPVRARIRYVFSGQGIIDLLAVIPYYLPFLGLDLRLLRILRVVRLFRVFKLARYVTALELITGVFRTKREELTVSFVLTMFMLLITASLMYFTEHKVQPDKFTSIPETLWWAIITLTTVGYGDVYPISTGGRILGGMIAIAGILVLALPVGILASGYNEALQERKKEPVCPHCGKKIHS